MFGKIWFLYGFLYNTPQCKESSKGHINFLTSYHFLTLILASKQHFVCIVQHIYLPLKQSNQQFVHQTQKSFRNTVCMYLWSTTTREKYFCWKIIVSNMLSVVLVEFCSHLPNHLVILSVKNCTFRTIRRNIIITFF